MTVALIPLAPVLEYYTAPKIAARAYLKAKVGEKEERDSADAVWLGTRPWVSTDGVQCTAV